MSMSDPIADMLTRIRNANQMKYKEVLIPSSKMKLEISDVKIQEKLFLRETLGVDEIVFFEFIQN
jgi:small subunit ribosomal protein S8